MFSKAATIDGAQRRRLLLVCALWAGAVLQAGGAGADDLNGYVELSGGFASASSRQNGTAPEVESSSRNVTQRYSLTFNRAFYPTLRLNSGLLLERSSSESESAGESSSGNSTQFSPNANLSFGNNFVSSSLGYSRSETSSSGSEIQDILQTYSGRLTLRPEGFPPVDVMVSRSDAFTSDRISKDTSTESIVLSTNYRPVPNLAFSYNGSMISSVDKVFNVENDTVSNSLSGSYGDRFFQNRLSLFSNATVSHSTSTFSSAGDGGEASQQVTALQAFFAVSDTPGFVPVIGDGRGPQTPPVTTWTDFTGVPGSPGTPGLLEGNRVAPLSAISLGIQPTVGGDTRLRNIGLFLPAGVAVNTLNVYVNQDLPQVIWSQFSWSIYTNDSQDPTTAQQWTQQNVIQSVNFESVFDPLTNSTLRRFVIRFSSLSNRNIKVVTNTLPQQSPVTLNSLTPAQRAALDQLFVTELEPALRTPVAQLPDQKRSSTSGLASLGGRLTILPDPSVLALYYDANGTYNFSSTDAGYSYSVFFSNGLSALRHFGTWITSSSRVSWETSLASAGETSNSLNLSLAMEARPLPTLSHNLTYSTRYQNSGGETTTSNSLFLTNSASLYRGVSVLLAGGVGTATDPDGADSKNALLTMGVNLVPNERLSVNLNYSENKSIRSGGGKPSSSSSSRSGAVGASYTPFRVLYLFGSIGFASSDTQAMNFTQNYGVSYSPFSDGTLTFSVAYNTSITTLSDRQVETVSPSLHWAIRPGWWMDLAYTHQVTSSTIDESVADVVATTLRASF